MVEEKVKSHKDNLPIGEILTKSWELLVKNINMYLILALIAIGLMIVIGILSAIVAGISIATAGGVSALSASQNQIAGSIPFVGGLLGFGIFGISVIAIASLFLSTWMLGAVTYAAYNVVKGNNVSAWGNYKLGLKKFWIFLGVSIIVSILVGIGLMLLVIPGIIVAIFLAYTYYLVVVENAGVGQAISRSFALAKKNWATILLIELIIGAVAMVLGWIPIVGFIAAPAASIFGTLAIALMYEKVK